MKEKQRVIDQIREAFRNTLHPGDAFLQGNFEGCEPFEATAPFQGKIEWSDVEAKTLDDNESALSFFSEGAFRFFLPAYLVADLNRELHTAEPLFYLTNGFSEKVLEIPGKLRIHQKVIGQSTFVNPRRYGAMTSLDHARCRLSVFTREEAAAIVEYLELRKELDTHGIDKPEIDAALECFWRERATNAPTHESLERYLENERDYLNDIQNS